MERTRLADATEGTSGGPVPENTQTMETFLGCFHPAQVERMARGCGGDAGPKTSGAKDRAADDWLLQVLSALRVTLQDGEIAIEEALAEGDTLAVRLAVPNPQLQSSRVVELAFHP